MKMPRFLSVEKGLEIPIVYNCGGYESLETLRLLEGLVEIYMPDFKYSDSKPAQEYSQASDYPENVKLALKEMFRQVGDLLRDPAHDIDGGGVDDDRLATGVGRGHLDDGGA